MWARGESGVDGDTHNNGGAEIKTSNWCGRQLMTGAESATPSRFDSGLSKLLAFFFNWPLRGRMWE